MSWLYMRIHPCETNPPIDPGFRAVDGVLAATAERQGCRTHRVRRAAAGNDRQQPGIVFPNPVGGLPGGADIFAVDG